jgi:hypothetical protein
VLADEHPATSTAKAKGASLDVASLIVPSRFIGVSVRYSPSGEDACEYVHAHCQEQAGQHSEGEVS